MKFIIGHAIRNAAISSALVLLIACTPKPAQQILGQHTMPWPERETQLSAIGCWTLAGRVGVLTNNDGGSVNLYWQQYGSDQFEIQLWGSFGAGHVVITGQRDAVSLSDGQGMYTAPDARSLVFTHTGWDLPVEYLHYWLRGLPVPSLSAELIWDQYNHLATIVQDNWTVDYLRYTSVLRTDLPSRINITHDSLRLRFIVNEWQLVCR